MTFEYYESTDSGPIIKVLGLGGGGGNAVEYMVQHGIEGVEFLCANTDVQALNSKTCDRKIQIGRQATRGLGAGANPELGKQAATEDQDSLSDHLVGTDMLFLTAGMGGGTGTGSIPVVAKLARDMGVLTVAVVTTPFNFEGKKRCAIAVEGTTELADAVDALIVIPNDNVLKMSNGARLNDSFAMSNDVLRSAVQGIAELVTNPGLINVDFADVRTVMQSTGRAMMGSASASGENRAGEAAVAAINSPLLGSVDVQNAKGVLVNITGGEDLRLDELSAVGDVIEQFASEHTNIVIGTTVDEDLIDTIKVTVVVAGLDSHHARANVRQGATSNPTGQAAARPSFVTPEPVPAYRLPESPSTASAEPSLTRPKNRDQSGAVPGLSRMGAAGVAMQEAQDEDWMSVPTFLRQQSD